jgi:hypothetical protein
MADVLPPLYQTWLDELLPGPVAPETRATCGSCPQLERPDGPPVERPFLPETKCCTYYPDLPNFLMGRILADTDPAGEAARTFLRQRIEGRTSVTPLGVAPLPLYETLFTALRAGRVAFGRTRTMRCPLYIEDGGNCGVWRHREATCATWYCKQDRGVAGSTFWRTMLFCFRAFEASLKHWCAERAGLAKEQLAELWSYEKERTTTTLDDYAFNNACDPGVYRRLWGDMGGDPVGFYVRCAEAVAPLRLADIQAIGGTSVTSAINALRVAYADLNRTQLPARVARGQAFVQIRRHPGKATVHHPVTAYDQLEIETSLANQLGRFDDRPVAEAIRELQAEGVAVDEALVRRLIDWNLFVPA